MLVFATIIVAVIHAAVVIVDVVVFGIVVIVAVVLVIEKRCARSLALRLIKILITSSPFSFCTIRIMIGIKIKVEIVI